MTQFTTDTNGKPLTVTIPIATLEQLVAALNNAEDALNNSQALIAGRERFGFAKTCYGANEIALGFVSPAIAAGHAALANAERVEPSITRIQHECLRIGEEVQRAAGELPDGYELEVYVERGYGCVYLRNPSYDVKEFSDTVDGISHCITQAIDHAKKMSAP